MRTSPVARLMDCAHWAMMFSTFVVVPIRAWTTMCIWSRMLQERRLLVTTDKGFAQHRSEAHHGILIVRLRQPNEVKIHERVMRAVRQFAESEWPGLLVVMRGTLQSVSRAEQG